MDNLTKQQKELIKDLKKEFTKRNVPSNSGGLINVDKIQSEFRQQSDRIEDIKLSNRGWEKHIKQRGLDDTKVLNKQLKELGLLASFPNTYFIKIEALDVCHTHMLTIRLYEDHEYEVLLKKNVDIAVGFHYQYKNERFDTLEQVVKHDAFITNLEKLYYEAQLKNKN